MNERTATRLAWGSWAAFVVVAVGGTLVSAFGDEPVTLSDLAQLLAFAAVITVGAIVATHRPDNPLGWIYIGLALWMLISGGLASSYARLSDARATALPGATFAEWFSNWGWAPSVGLLITYVFLLFPDGHLPSPRWRPVAWAAALGTSALTISFMFQSADYTDSAGRHVPNPFTTPDIGRFFDVAKVPAALLMLSAGVLSVASLFVRYRRGDRDERQQLKWLMLAGVLLVTAFSLPVEYGDGDPLDVLLGLAIALVPIACGVAILKYRLYEIDVVINRAVVFGVLAAFISLVYVGIVVGLGALLGQGGDANPALQIAATAVVAVAFQPVRGRVQRLANRLVYGERATPYEVVSDFSRRMAGTLETGEAVPQMAEVAARGVGAIAGRVRLFLPGGGERVVTWPGDAPASVPTRSIEVRHQGETIGEIAVTKAPGDALLPAEDALLQDLAGQAGLALHNVRLTEELEARLEDLAIQADQLKTSRQRLVTARDAQRRGLERDISEGPRHRLSAIAEGVDRARALAGVDPTAASATLEELSHEANATLEGLRDLARDIFPPLLADKGIVAALDAHIRKVGVRATIEASPGLADLRFEDRTEACAYFCCLQALQNVARHAGGEAVVRLSLEGDMLTFVVRDHGPGFEPATTRRGMGLEIMQDRVDALDGTLEVVSVPGAGTTVTGRIRARTLEPAP